VHVFVTVEMPPYPVFIPIVTGGSGCADMAPLLKLCGIWVGVVVGGLVVLRQSDMPRFKLRTEKIGNSVHVACRLYNYATVRRVQHTGFNKLLEMGYCIAEKKSDIGQPGVWRDVVHIQKEGITIEKFMEDCKAAGVTTTVEYEWDSFFRQKEHSSAVQLPWDKSAVRKELK
jgi:hypothetical protein